MADVARPRVVGPPEHRAAVNQCFRDAGAGDHGEGAWVENAIRNLLFPSIAVRLASADAGGDLLGG
jgi:hypothetical protein